MAKRKMMSIPTTKQIKQSTYKERFRHLHQLVGNTPMVQLFYKYKGSVRSIFAKCENYNLTGSIKDRMALYILEKAFAHQSIQPGDRIVEATSGNTGIAFSAIGKSLGHPVTIIMPDWLSKERISIMKSLGAEVILVSKQQGGFLGSIALSREMAGKDSRIFLPQQFDNNFNAEAHTVTTAHEIWQQLASIGLKPSAFVAGVGTGGTIMGVGKYLKEKDATIMVHPLEPKESPTLSTGFKVGSHRIQGISDEFIPSIVDLTQINEVVQASDGDSIIMAQKIATQLGLAVGISSGANLIGAIQVQEKLGSDAVVVTVLSDSNKKYLSTDLMRKEPIRSDYFSTEVNFLEFRAIARLS